MRPGGTRLSDKRCEPAVGRGTGRDQPVRVGVSAARPRPGSGAAGADCGGSRTRARSAADGLGSRQGCGPGTRADIRRSSVRRSRSCAASGRCRARSGSASGFLPTPPRDDAVASGSELASPLPPGDFHPQAIAHAGRTQGGACGAAGPASAPGSALGGPPGARRTKRSAAPQISPATGHACSCPVLPWSLDVRPDMGQPAPRPGRQARAPRSVEGTRSNQPEWCCRNASVRALNSLIFS
jgi:hypothetical protein